MTMNNVSQFKTPSVQAYKLLVYSRALHPELFGIQNRRTISQSGYEMEAWITPGGHILRFQSDGSCVTEAVVGHDMNLPSRGLMNSVPCLGEKEMDPMAEGSISYVSSIQTETLSDNLYQSTFEEMVDFANETEAMRVQWNDPDGSKNLSVVDVQRYKKEIHAQAYHLVGSAGFILRTQTLFELL